MITRVYSPVRRRWLRLGKKRPLWKESVYKAEHFGGVADARWFCRKFRVGGVLILQGDWRENDLTVNRKQRRLTKP